MKVVGPRSSPNGERASCFEGDARDAAGYCCPLGGQVTKNSLCQALTFAALVVFVVQSAALVWWLLFPTEESGVKAFLVFGLVSLKGWAMAATILVVSFVAKEDLTSFTRKAARIVGFSSILLSVGGAIHVYS